MVRTIAGLVVMGLMLFGVLGVNAQDKTPDGPPIIAVANNDIYSVSPQDSSSQRLVDRDNSLDKQLRDLGVFPHVELSHMSPDQQHIAFIAPLYEMLNPNYEEYRKSMRFVRPNDLFLLNIVTGEQSPITNQEASFGETLTTQYKVMRYLSPRWSLDGQRLYFQSIELSLRNRLPITRIEYYDLASKTHHVLTNINTDVERVNLYVFEEGIGVHLLNDEGFVSELELQIFDADDGHLVTTYPLSIIKYLSSINFWISERNPVRYEGKYYFAYFETPAEDILIPTLLDVGTGETILYPVVNNKIPAMGRMSQNDSEKSFRFILHRSDNTNRAWSATDHEGRIQFDIWEIFYEYEMTLSADGETVALIQKDHSNTDDEVPITMVNAEGTWELDFRATAIQWAATDYILDYASR